MPIANGFGSSPVFGIALAAGGEGGLLCLLLEDGTELLLEDLSGCLLLEGKEDLGLLQGGDLELLMGGNLQLLTP
jgi:hypothetical protein